MRTALLVILSVFLSACGRGPGGMAGTWSIDAEATKESAKAYLIAQNEGKEPAGLDARVAVLSKALAATAPKLELKADGTFSLNLVIGLKSGTWTASGDTVTLNVKDDKAITLQKSGGKLRLRHDPEKPEIVLKRE